MAYIQPTSNIKILKDVPLNASYDDTFTFNTLEEQYNYFTSKAKFELINYSVIRDRTNALKVEGDIGDFYDTNYLMFKNTDFGDKWFYAFIIDTEYVNPNTTILIFQIDVMQSWMFEYTILPSLVEREHVYDDSLYANLVPENIQVNERIPFSQPFNTNRYIGSKILVMGFTENPLNSAVIRSGVIPYNCTTQYPNYSLDRDTSFDISKISVPNNVYFEHDTSSNWSGKFILKDDSITEFTFHIKPNTSFVLGKNVRAVYDGETWTFEAQ